jgi:hypothetical protein
MSGEQRKGIKKKHSELSVPRGEGHDAKRVRDRLAGFDWEACEAWTVLRQTFGRGITTNEIKSIAFIICDHCPPLKVDRDAQRDGRVLIKWFQENLNVVQPQLANVELRDEDELVIDSRRDINPL